MQGLNSQVNSHCHCADVHETAARSTIFVNKTYTELNENLTNGSVAGSISQLDKNMNEWTLCPRKAYIYIYIYFFFTLKRKPKGRELNRVKQR
jgi:hypothetical protein